jgi:hypothetical protein
VEGEGKWRATLAAEGGGQVHALGLHSSAEAAARSHDLALLKLEGCRELGKLNFPLPQYKQVGGGTRAGGEAGGCSWQVAPCPSCTTEPCCQSCPVCVCAASSQQPAASLATLATLATLAPSLLL